MDRHRLALPHGWVAVLFLCGLATAAGPGDRTKIAWHTDLKAAHKIAVREQKPMLIVFGAEWCVYCKKLEAETLGNPVMASYVRSEFIPLRLDFDRDAEIADILEVKSLPCTVVLSPEADLLGRIDGYVKAGEYQAALKKARQLQIRLRQIQYANSRPEK